MSARAESPLSGQQPVGPSGILNDPTKRPQLRVIRGGKEVARAKLTQRALKRRGTRDARLLSGLVAGLAGLGLVMVLASSAALSAAQNGSPWSIALRQVMWMGIASFGFVAASKVKVMHVRRCSRLALVVSTGLLLAVIVPGIGKGSGGASRWIGIGPITIQPSELMKLAFLLFAADLMVRRSEATDVLRNVVRPILLVLAFVDILIVKQPDLGTAIVVVCVAIGILYSGGVSRRILCAIAGGALFFGTIMSAIAPYRRARFFSFIHPFQNVTGPGYQLAQSLYALGSGHVFGAGLASSPATWGMLPNAHTDFVFAVIGNDLGLVGSVAVVVAFVIFGWLGIRIAARARDRFSSLVAAGITCLVVAQALINIGGVIGVLPETGIPLPFLSFGGSSLVVTLVACGILVNIARHPDASSTTELRS